MEFYFSPSLAAARIKLGLVVASVGLYWAIAGVSEVCYGATCQQPSNMTTKGNKRIAVESSRKKCIETKRHTLKIPRISNNSRKLFKLVKGRHFLFIIFLSNDNMVMQC